MARFKFLPLACLAVSTFSLIVGCSDGGGQARPDVVPVSGKVLYNGKAVDGAIVTFMTKGAARTATGMTNANGEFKLTTFDTDDGAPLGKHAVTISKSAPGSTASSTSTMKPEDSANEYADMMTSGKGLPTANALGGEIPVKYANAEESGLKRTVVKGDTNVFNFDLKD